jgi:hypothetical protein
MISRAQVDHPEDQGLQGQLFHHHVLSHENIIGHHYTPTQMDTFFQIAYGMKMY